MTDKQFVRLNELVEKMNFAAEQAEREYTDTADLTDAERAEYREIMKNEAVEPCLMSMLAGADDGRIGILSDAVW